jgi:excinuclease ABC subunit A
LQPSLGRHTRFDIRRSPITMEPRYITVKGAREHNLQGISLKLPRGKLICFTGVSGSGKSSFAFDTLFTEGQRRYIESLSSYARQFLGQFSKPDVDQITGLSPSVSIQQKTSGWNPRSTVGTITQIHDYLRVLFARVGRQHCPDCGQAISAQTREQIIGRILQETPEAKIFILAPVVRGQKGEYRDLFEDMRRQGYARARVDGEIINLADPPALQRHVRHQIEIVIDRLTLSSTSRLRLAEAVEAALKLGDGALIVHLLGHDPSPTLSSGKDGAPGAVDGTPARRGQSTIRNPQSEIKGRDLLLSSHYACPKCGISFEPPSPQLFSFNSPTGMCLTCDGMGTKFDFDPELLVPNPRRSFLGLAVEPMRTRIGKWRRHIYRAVAKHVGFDLKTPWNKLPKKAKDALLYGLGDTHLTFEWRWSGGVWRHGGTFDGVIEELRQKHRKAKSGFVRAYYEKYMRKTVCPDCAGGRLNRQATAVRIGGLNINEVSTLTIEQACDFFEKLKLNQTERLIAADALKEIMGRLGFLRAVGLDYLTLERTAPTLAGGESQRIRLASQIGAGLVGVLYILDEPSIGLHHRDNRRLLDSLERLRDMGNTVIVVEHDEETMRTADEIVDFGPGPGIRGGKVVAHGDIDTIIKSKRSITGKYLRGDEEIEVPKKRRLVSKRPK